MICSRVQERISQGLPPTRTEFLSWKGGVSDGEQYCCSYLVYSHLVHAKATTRNRQNCPPSLGTRKRLNGLNVRVILGGIRDAVGVLRKEVLRNMRGDYREASDERVLTPFSSHEGRGIVGSGLEVT